MQRHFHEELNELKQLLTQMASLVEISISNAILSLKQRDNAIADDVINKDDKINNLEIKIDEESLRLLALQQPMAVDLRFITSAMKINNDLERMGDHAVNIAECAKKLNEQEQLKPLIDIPRMAEIAQGMLRDSLESFLNGNVKTARAVCIRDDEIDQLDEQIFRELASFMAEDPRTISRALNLILVSKNLERIADLSTNISEEVIFIYNARTIKHHIEERKGDEAR